MTKRIFDIIVAVLIAFLVFPLILVISLIIYIRDGRPIFYISERMKTPEEGFSLIKFRTMRCDNNDQGMATGEYKNNRITKLGIILRKTKIDEIPQLWNVLIGDMSFVGPRPPLRRYVKKFPELYNRVLVNRPGITGLASIYFHKHEAWLLRKTLNIEASERIYCNICVPRKAKLDLIYLKNQNLCLDILLMFKTIFK